MLLYNLSVLANFTDILEDQIIKNVCVCSCGSVAVIKSFGEL